MALGVTNKLLMYFCHATKCKSWTKIDSNDVGPYHLKKEMNGQKYIYYMFYVSGNIMDTFCMKYDFFYF